MLTGTLAYITRVNKEIFQKKQFECGTRNA
jgi:hypothetical protein